MLAVTAAWGLLMLASAAPVAGEAVPFDSGRWAMPAGKVVEHLGRPALAGSAFLPDASFEDGVVEVDVAVTGARSYPGVVFRSQADGSWERVYLRPHRAGATPTPLYPDVVQYVPSWNRVDSWQLYSGEGCTAPAPVPAGRWFTLRIEVKGTQARVFVDGAAEPALRIDRLRHGRRSGGLGLVGPPDGSAFFSAFRFRPDPGLRFDPPAPLDRAPGLVRDWEISRPLPALLVDPEKTPSEQGLADLGWKPAVADEDGLVDLSRHHARSGEPDLVFARTTIRAEKEEVRPYTVGYSDGVAVFVNGRKVFTGESGYQSRDPSFLGILGPFDTAYLPLRKGDNELLLMVWEVSGGWGFRVQDATATFLAPGVSALWETPRRFRMPESAAREVDTGTIYVSNFDPFRRSPEGLQSISKLRPDGTVEALDWLTGLRNPTGLALRGDRLYAVEPRALVEIDVTGRRIVARHEAPTAGMLNDVAVAPDGTVFVSDFAKGAILRLTGDRLEEWLSGPEVVRPNGLCVVGGTLFWGDNGAGGIKAADLARREARLVARLGRGLVDGLAAGPDGSLLVSHNEGRLFRVSPAGEATKILDLSVVGTPVADFDYDPASGVVVFPTFRDGRVMAYRLEEK